MKFRRIRLAHFAGVDEVEVTFATTGVSLVVGPNEAGKTTLMKAVDLLFDRLDSSKAADVLAVKPVHVDEGAQVELEAVCGEYVFSYSKRWHKRPQTKLKVTRPRSENFTGREAHERVQQILAEAVDVDLWKALRVQQGEELSQPTGLLAHGALAAALDAEAGQSFADPNAESLLSRAESECETYYTPTGRERDALKRPAQDVSEIQEQLATAREKLRALERDVVRHAELDRRIEELEASVPGAEQRLKDAQEAVRLLEVREKELEHALERAESAAKEAARSEREHEERCSLVEEVARLGKTARERAREAVESAAPLKRAKESAEDAKVAFDTANRAFVEARQLDELRREDLEYERALLDAAQIGERLERIEKAEEDAAEARELLAGETIDAKVLQRFRKLGVQIERARAVLEVGSPRLAFEARRSVELKEGDESHALTAGGSHEISVTEAREFEVDDLLLIRIQPGEDAGDRTKGLRDAEDQLAQELARHRVEHIEAAAERLDAKDEAERTVSRAKEARKENLRDLTLDELRAKHRSVEERAARPPVRGQGSPPAPNSFDEAQQISSEASVAVRTCEDDREEARRDYETRREAWEKAAADAAEIVRASENAARDHDRQRNALEAARQSESDQAFVRRVRVTGDEAEERREIVGELERKLDLDDPEATRAGLDGAKSALEKINEERRDAREERAGVRGRLDEAEREGLAERIEDLASKLERAERDLRLARERAGAAKLLFETLSAARSEARKAYATPLADRIRRLGRQVFGRSFEVTLGDNLEIVERAHDGRVVPFESLSGGTREQLSVIARVAAAMLVAKDGGVPVILDDALGYSDPERLRGMARVLTLAGRECQVILLTCAPDRYREIADPHEIHIG